MTMDEWKKAGGIKHKDYIEYMIIADDVDVNREMLSEMFLEQYQILEAADGKETIQYLEKYQDEVVMVLLDLYMPNIDGFGVLEYMNHNHMIDSIPVIMITGDCTTKAQQTGYNYGVSDIIYKPFVHSIVKRRAQNVIELYRNKRNMERYIEEQSWEIRRSSQELKETNEYLIDALSSLVEFRNLESGEHIKRIKYLTKTLLKYLARYYPEFNMTQERMDLITRASAMHDIGKIGIAEKILCKPGKLTAEEFEVMKTHTTIGCEILKKFDRMKDQEFYHYCYEICRYHHERWDGRGYPDHLVGEQIPISAQIVAVADVYDALVNKRVYKDAFAHETAVKMIENGECGQFSPIAMECFELAREDFHAIFEMPKMIADWK